MWKNDICVLFLSVFLSLSSVFLSLSVCFLLPTLFPLSLSLSVNKGGCNIGGATHLRWVTEDLCPKAHHWHLMTEVHPPHVLYSV